MMPEIRESSRIHGVRTVSFEPHRDERGEFIETFRRSWFPERAWDDVQSNRSISAENVLRGLHYHLRQADYWIPLSGRIQVGLVDLRKGSPTNGNTELFEVGEDRPRGVFVPPGVGHGFLTLSPSVLFYMVDRYYDPEDELGVAWNDPDVGLEWGTSSPLLSPRDRSNPRLKDIAAERLPLWEG